MTPDLKICIYGAPILKKKISPVSFIADEEREIFSAMIEVMHRAKGVGLAANQVGINKRMLVIDIGTGVIKIANPKIIKKSGRAILEEGCLSLPGISIKVERAKDIVVYGINEYNQEVKIAAHDLLARVFQHEVDHLNGRLIIDYLPWYKRLVFKKMVSKIRSKRDDRMPK